MTLAAAAQARNTSAAAAKARERHLRLAIPDPSVRALDFSNDRALRLYPTWLVIGQAARRLLRVLQPHGDVDFLPVVKRGRARGGNPASDAEGDSFAPCSRPGRRNGAPSRTEKRKQVWCV